MTTNYADKQPRPFGPFAANLQRFITGVHTFLYRVSGGALLGRMGGGPVLILTTIGRKSGKPRTLPLLYLTDENRFVLVASNGGTVSNPLWWRNLQANPHAQIQVGSQKLEITARIATPEERTRLWPQLVAMYAGYADYQERTPREIPVVILQRESMMRVDVKVS